MVSQRLCWTWRAKHGQQVYPSWVQSSSFYGSIVTVRFFEPFPISDRIDHHQAAIGRGAALAFLIGFLYAMDFYRFLCCWISRWFFTSNHLILFHSMLLFRSWHLHKHNHILSSNKYLQFLLSSTFPEAWDAFWIHANHSGQFRMPIWPALSNRGIGVQTGCTTFTERPTFGSGTYFRDITVQKEQIGEQHLTPSWP